MPAERGPTELALDVQHQRDVPEIDPVRHLAEPSENGADTARHLNVADGQRKQQEERRDCVEVVVGRPLPGGEPAQIPGTTQRQGGQQPRQEGDREAGRRRGREVVEQSVRSRQAWRQTTQEGEHHAEGEPVQIHRQPQERLSALARDRVDDDVRHECSREQERDDRALTRGAAAGTSDPLRREGKHRQQKVEAELGHQRPHLCQVRV